MRLQQLLGLPADGIFGPRTRAAVIRFQRVRGLPATGVVAARTWNALARTPAAPRGGSSPPRISCPVARPRTATDGFGDARSGGRRHNGSDVFSRYGNPVLAVETGVVVRSYRNPRGGLSIVLRGEGSRDSFYYAHQSSNAVRSGQRVGRGAVIGRVGTSGNAAGTPPHVHFEWWPNGGSARDPYPMLRRACG